MIVLIRGQCTVVLSAFIISTAMLIYATKHTKTSEVEAENLPMSTHSKLHRISSRLWKIRKGTNDERPEDIAGKLLKSVEEMELCAQPAAADVFTGGAENRGSYKCGDDNYNGLKESFAYSEDLRQSR